MSVRSIKGFSSASHNDLSQNQIDENENNVSPIKFFGSLEELKNFPGDLSSVALVSLEGSDNEKLSQDVSMLSGLTYLDLTDNKLNTFPVALTTLVSLKILKIGLDKSPGPMPAIGNMERLEELEIQRTCVDGNPLELPPDIGPLSGLKKLLASYCQIESVPESLCQSSSLKLLDLSLNQIQTLPDMNQMTGLKKCFLQCNQLEEIPESITQLTQLTRLVLHENKLRRLPEEMGSLTNLKGLTLWVNELERVPDSLTRLRLLKELSLDSNKVSQLPNEIGNMASLTHLSVADNSLKSLPDTIIQLIHLQKLNLGRNQLETLPDHLPEAIAELDLSYNRFHEVPSSIQKLENLLVLRMTNNSIREVEGLPEGFKNEERLGQNWNEINFSYNRITKISADFFNPLLALDLSHNRLKALPEIPENQVFPLIDISHNYFYPIPNVQLAKVSPQFLSDEGLCSIL